MAAKACDYGGAQVTSAQPMLIGLPTDKNYVELAGILIRSIVVNGDVPDATIVVCGYGLDASDHAALAACATPLAIRFYDLGVAQERLAHAAVNDRWPLATWGRVMLPEMVAETEGRLLFLDSDIVVAKSLRPLADLDIEGHTLACVPVDKDQRFVDELNVNLGRKLGTDYFNVGVMLIDIAAWRRDGITDAALGVARIFGEKLKFVDQDALNLVMDGKFYHLDRRWNWYRTAGDYTFASIIHYVYDKPHISGSKHPARGLYKAFRSQTIWANRPLLSPWKKRRAKWARKLAALFVGPLQ